MHLGMRQARYVGRTKTLFQLLLAATVANLTLVATRLGMLGARYDLDSHSHSCFSVPIRRLIAHLALIFSRDEPTPRSGARLRTGFRPRF